MTAMVETFAALIAISISVIAFAHLRFRDRVLVATLVVAAAIRFGVGLFNARHGPLPGAEIDAVYYLNTAVVYASNFIRTGHFQLDFGRSGYSSLLSIPIILGGKNILLATFMNMFFALHFIVIVYEIARRLSTPQRARFVAFITAIYPTAVLYTSVPLREAPLMWALAIWTLGMLKFYKQVGRLINWRALIGLAVGTWLNSGFVILGLLMAVIWGLRRTSSRDRAHAGSGLVRWIGMGLGALIFLALFAKFGGLLPKLPTEPSELTNLEYLNNVRQYKASYGTGYVGYAPTNWKDFTLFLPVFIFRFLFSPTPLDVARAGGGLEAAKLLDSLFFFVMSVSAFRSVRRAYRIGQGRLALVFALIFLALSAVFGLGTANVGIAIRHRAKFAWILVLIIGVWRHKLPGTKLVQPAPVFAREVKQAPIAVEA